MCDIGAAGAAGSGALLSDSKTLTGKVVHDSSPVSLMSSSALNHLTCDRKQSVNENEAQSVSQMHALFSPCLQTHTHTHTYTQC